MHELVHLDFVIEARKMDLNQLFIATQHHKTDFVKLLDLTITKFRKMDLEEDAINNYCNGIL